MKKRPPMQMTPEARVPLPAGHVVLTVEEALVHPVVCDLRYGVPLLASHQPHSCHEPSAGDRVLVVGDVVRLAEELARRRGDSRGRLMIQDIWHDMLLAGRFAPVAPGRDAFWIADRLHPSGGCWAWTLSAAARRIAERLIGSGRPRRRWLTADADELRLEAEEIASLGGRSRSVRPSARERAKLLLRLSGRQ